jgi:hypothetical protein
MLGDSHIINSHPVPIPQNIQLHVPIITRTSDQQEKLCESLLRQFLILDGH